MPQKKCAYYATLTLKSRKWGQDHTAPLGGGGGAGADKAPRGGSGDIITATGPEEGLCGSGVSVSHFLLTSWKPLDGI